MTVVLRFKVAVGGDNEADVGPTAKKTLNTEALRGGD